jgi:hypothetical protein
MANGLWRGIHRAAANLADELDADWEQVKVRFVAGKAASKIALRQEPSAPFLASQRPAHPGTPAAIMRKTGPSGRTSGAGTYRPRAQAAVSQP